jgi:small subunit ribosomal protein S8
MDPIANLLSKIKNAALVGKEYVEVSYSKEKEAIMRVLEKEGFVKKVKVFKPKDEPAKGLHIDLAYNDNRLPVIMDLRRVSKPGRRIYRKSTELKSVKGGYGLLVVSTSRGIMSGAEARKKRLGGELICEVW